MGTHLTAHTFLLPPLLSLRCPKTATYRSEHTTVGGVPLQGSLMLFGRVARRDDGVEELRYLKYLYSTPTQT